jgi:ATPase subunit of ABC transporter with duplicated ATPase domains
MPNCKISYMKQQISTDNYDQTIIEFIREYTGIDKIQQEIDLLSEDLSDPANLQAYSDKYEIFEKM